VYRAQYNVASANVNIASGRASNHVKGKCIGFGFAPTRRRLRVRIGNEADAWTLHSDTKGHGQMAYIVGTNGHDVIDDVYWDVSDDTDIIYGKGGKDEIYGLGGVDHITGGTGADYIDGGANDDWAYYDDSNAGVRVSLATGTGHGGTAEGDTLVSIEHLAGSAYDDTLVGNSGNNRLWGNGGDDTLKGGGGTDTLSGGEHDDVLKGGGGADRLYGDGGNDTAAYQDSTSGVSVELGVPNGAPGSGSTGDAAGDVLFNIENLIGSQQPDILLGNDVANMLQGLDGDDTLAGYGDVDVLYGGEDNDSLYGGAQADTLRGENGNDRLEGGPGADVMIGAYGDDRYYVDDPSDVVIEFGGQGYDQVLTSISWTLPEGADVEVFRTSIENDLTPLFLTGNSSGNGIRGNLGNNLLNGREGNDELTGLQGQDLFVFNTALDAAHNVDTITDFNVADDTILLDDTIFSSNLGVGNISAGELVIGSAALDANDRIIYDSNTGALSYDADGAGGNAAVQFAELPTGLALTYLDFLVY
jgi:Ca2+-binding RTX toxin-like protein